MLKEQKQKSIFGFVWSSFDSNYSQEKAEDRLKLGFLAWRGEIEEEEDAKKKSETEAKEKKWKNEWRLVIIG